MSELLKKGVIRKAHHSNKEYISPIFVRPKKDNRWRIILNLKELNKDVEYFHFKMETLKKCLGFSLTSFFCSLDLKDAYFSVHVNESSQEYLKFLGGGGGGGSALHVHSFSQWVSMLPKIIHKIAETSDVPSSYARLCVNKSLFDDTLLMGYSQKECVQNVRSSLALFKSLGFVVCPTKSVLIPSHKITYLGFETDSQSMTVASTLERKQNIEYNLQIAVWELVYCKGVSAVHRAGRFMFSGSKVRTALVSLHEKQTPR